MPQFYLPADMTTEEIIRTLSSFSPVPPREALSNARNYRRELTPIFLESLNDLAAADSIGSPSGDLAIYAMHLLAEWREARAHPSIARVFDRHAQAVFESPPWHPFIRINGSLLLAQTAGTSVDAIWTLASDPHGNITTRCVAIEALVALAAWRKTTREFALTGLRQLIRQECVAKSSDPEELLMAVADAAMMLDADELRSEFQTARRTLQVDLADLPERIGRDWSRPPPEPFDDSAEALTSLLDVPLADLTYEADEPRSPYDFRIPLPRDPHPPPKTGRNVPCPCGSGKKFKLVVGDDWRLIGLKEQPIAHGQTVPSFLTISTRVR